MKRRDVTEDQDQAPAPAKAARGRAKTAAAPAPVPPMRATAMAEFGVLAPHPAAPADVSEHNMFLWALLLCWPRVDRMHPTDQTPPGLRAHPTPTPCSHHQVLGSNSEWRQYLEVRRHAASVAPKAAEAHDSDDEGEYCEMCTKGVMGMSCKALDGIDALTDAVGASGRRVAHASCMRGACVHACRRRLCGVSSASDHACCRMHAVHSTCQERTLLKSSVYVTEARADYFEFDDVRGLQARAYIFSVDR